MNEQELREQFPEIEWDTPLRLIGRDGIIRYACRFCFQIHMPTAMNLDVWPDEIALWAEHQAEQHDAR